MEYNKYGSSKIIILLSIFTLILFLLLSKLTTASPYTLFNYFGETYSTNDTNQYGNFDNHINGEKGGCYSDLTIFPEKIPSSAKDTKYFYLASNKDIFDNHYQIFLQYTLSEEDFLKELGRISDLKLTSYDKNFILPAYKRTYGSPNNDEYILINENAKQIIYIFTQFVAKKDIRFDTKYLPKDFAF